MKISYCQQGHTYDSDKCAVCPQCMAQKIEKSLKEEGEEGQQKGETQPADGEETGEKGGTVLLNQGTVLLKEGTVLLKEGTVLLEEGELSQNETKAPTPEEIFAPKAPRGNEEEDREKYRKAAEERCLNCMRTYDTEAEKMCPHCGFVQGTEPETAFHLHPGSGLAGRYVIGTVLGFGGFGITYRAWDIKLQAVVAIKEYYPVSTVNRIPGESQVILFPGKSGEEFQAGFKRFLEEVRNTVQFNEHPNIVHVFDYFEENGTAYMVMELLRGVSLEEYMKLCQGKVSWQEAVPIFSFVAKAVEEMHRKNMIHRDLSPDNIFICQDGVVKLMDLGAARNSDAGSDVNQPIILKRGMAPPEQYAKNGIQGPWTDVYALSATLYWAVTGVEPEESTDRAREDLVKKPRELVSDIPEYLENAIMKGMSLLPELRFKNMEEFAKAVRNEKKVQELRAEIAVRRRRRNITIAAAACALTAVCGVGMAIYSEERSRVQLKPARVTIWLPLGQGEEEEMEAGRWEAGLQEFRETYPHIQAEVVLIAQEEYEERVREALSQKSPEPVLFESSFLKEGETEQLASLEEAMELMDTEEYYFLDRYSSWFPENTQLPLGFDMEVLYENTLLSESMDPAEENRLSDFLTQLSPSCVAGVSELYRVQEELPGLYTILSLPEQVQTAVFSDVFSVNPAATEAQRQAGNRLLYYGLSESGQEGLHITSQGSLPLMKSQMEVFTEVNRELSFIEDRVSRLSPEKSADQEKTEEAVYQELYDSGWLNAPE